jgi:putative ABC transport system permease protein
VIDIAMAEIVRKPGRTALRTFSIAAAVAVTLLFEGFRLGVDRQMAAPARSLPAPLVAIEKGASHFVALPSRLPQATRAAIERSPGVAAAHPLVSVPVIFETAGRRTPLELVAYDSAGAPALDEGEPISGSHQIVLDRRLARAHGLRVGDSIRLLSRDFQVVGLSRNTDVFFSPLAHVTYDELIDTYLASDVPGAMGGAPLLSFLLVDLQPGIDTEEARRTLRERVEGADFYTPAELAAHDVALGRQLFGPVMNLLVTIAWVVVILAVALTMYGAVIDRRRELGVMKAIGVGTARLAAALVAEALIVALVALPFSFLIARGAAAAVSAVHPLFQVVPWAPAVLVRGSVAALGAAVLGALVPLRPVARLEPDLVFRG